MEFDEELQFDFDERRAIMEIDGGLSREDAEWEALKLIEKRYGYSLEGKNEQKKQ